MPRFETKDSYMAKLKRQFFLLARGRQGLIGHDLSFKHESHSVAVEKLLKQ